MKLQTLPIIAILVSSLNGQVYTPDPFREPNKPPAAPAAPVSSMMANLSICYEAFSLPLPAAAKLQREQLADSELYKRVLAALEKNTARQESLVVLRARSGQKAMSDSVSEQMYPSSYEPPEMPSTVGVAISPPQVKDSPTPMPEPAKLENAPDLAMIEPLENPRNARGVLTRKAGTTLEVEATLDETGTIVDLMSFPTIATLVGRSSWGQGLSVTELPIFESQTVHTASLLRVNQPFLIGTINRPPDSKVDPDSANRVWFAFVTATIAKP